MGTRWRIAPVLRPAVISLPRVITIAGSDSGGGAGIQADLKTITALGGYGMCALTAVTAQSTMGIRGVLPVPPEFVALQMEAVLEDIGVDAAKTGMLVGAATVRAVADVLAGRGVGNVVVDPVTASTSGAKLLDDDGLRALKDCLLPLSYVVTPNLAEAEVLSGVRIDGLAGMRAAARRIRDFGVAYVLVKGGHLLGQPTDLLFDGVSFTEFPGERIAFTNTHGTGCTFAAAIATLIGKGIDVAAAVEQAKSFVASAIRNGLALGRGIGPVGVAHQ